MKDKTNLIEFKTYRFPSRVFLLTKNQIKVYRELEGEIIEKEAELFELIKDKEVKGE